MQIEHADSAAEIWLEEQLLASLRSINVQSENSSIVLVVKEPDDRIAGGLVAGTSYGWCLVKILWVAEEFRGKGFGRKLMEEVERSATRMGCHSSWLDTSSESAYRFYTALGYETFGELSNGTERAPVGHHRWFMKKTLAV